MLGLYGHRGQYCLLRTAHSMSGEATDMHSAIGVETFTSFEPFLCAFLSLCVPAELFDGQASCYKKFCCPIPSGKRG
ncbi:hypothetical protein AGR5A_Cc170307 [Agrobacterium genomosp. 5 str. CFBP 6626]|nr:hypothetical protein AGR5A_Cc170307 [Agrobacterium genomosp. 5 str. CFBP 6626]